MSRLLREARRTQRIADSLPTIAASLLDSTTPSIVTPPWRPGRLGGTALRGFLMKAKRRDGPVSRPANGQPKNEPLCVSSSSCLIDIVDESRDEVTAFGLRLFAVAGEPLQP